MKSYFYLGKLAYDKENDQGKWLVCFVDIFEKIKFFFIETWEIERAIEILFFLQSEFVRKIWSVLCNWPKIVFRLLQNHQKECT